MVAGLPSRNSTSHQFERGLDLARSQSKQTNRRCFMFINAIVFPSPESSSFSRHKLNALFRISIFILIAVSIALFRTNAHAVQVKVTFDPSPDIRVIGHKIYYCQSANMSKTNYSEKIDLGTKTVYLTPHLKEETTYYFAATAYDKYGNT
jgi:hypothetical protein